GRIGARADLGTDRIGLARCQRRAAGRQEESIDVIEQQFASGAEMQGRLIAAYGILEVDDAAFAGVGRRFEDEAVEGGGQAVVGRTGAVVTLLSVSGGAGMVDAVGAVGGGAGVSGTGDVRRGVVAIARVGIGEDQRRAAGSRTAARYRSGEGHALAA